MARYDVYRLDAAYVLDVQAPLLEHLATRVVVPLRSADKSPRPIGELNPVFTLAGERHVLLTQALAAVPVRELGKTITSLAAHRDEISKALDLLLTGF